MWTLSSGKNCITFHGIIDNKNKNVINLKSFLDKRYRFELITIQLETIEENLKLKCDKKSL